MTGVGASRCLGGLGEDGLGRGGCGWVEFPGVVGVVGACDERGRFACGWRTVWVSGGECAF